jgi:hypothetical protein
VHVLKLSAVENLGQEGTLRGRSGGRLPEPRRFGSQRAQKIQETPLGGRVAPGVPRSEVASYGSGRDLEDPRRSVDAEDVRKGVDESRRPRRRVRFCAEGGGERIQPLDVFRNRQRWIGRVRCRVRCGDRHQPHQGHESAPMR